MYRGWVKLAVGVGCFALACDVAAAVLGPPSSRDPTAEAGMSIFLAGFGLLAGLASAGVACIAHAYWVHGDGNVTGRARLALGCLVPLALAAGIFLMWGAYFLWLYHVPESLWMWTIVGPPLFLAFERLVGPLSAPKE